MISIDVISGVFFCKNLQSSSTTNEVLASVLGSYEFVMNI